MLILLTGNPNSGKTQLLNLLGQEHYDVFNVDEFINEIYEVNQIGYILIQTHFGKEYTTNKAVNKAKLRKLVLADNYNMYRLKILIWPLIKSKLNYLRKRYDMMIVEMAIYKIDPLYFDNLFDYVIEVSREKSLINHDFKNIYNSNHPCYQPDFVVHNNDDLLIAFSTLKEKLDELKKGIKTDLEI